MKTADSLHHVKQRVDDYLWRSKAEPIRRLRAVLDEHFLRFDSIAIIGGLVRDLALHGRDGFSSDVDLVIDVDPISLDDFAISLGATRNRFGGFGLSTPWWKIDFWALRNTWAYRQHYVNLRQLSDIMKTTFFDCDAIIYDLRSRKVMAMEGYVQRLHDRVIDINLLPNPSTDGNLIRAIRRILMWDMKAGPKLRHFIDNHLDDDALERICRVEKAIYPISMASKFDTAIEARKACSSYRERAILHSLAKTQLHLPLIYSSN